MSTHMKYCYCNKLNENIYRLVKIDDENMFNFAKEFKDINNFGGNVNTGRIDINGHQTYLHYIITASFNGKDSIEVTFFDDEEIERTETINGEKANIVKQFILNNKCK